MKQILFVLLVISLSANAQNGTTVEEFNYASKGYKIQIESGLDTKKGYKITDLDFVSPKSFRKIKNIKVKALYRATQQKPCAYIIVMNSDDLKSVNYICLPSANSTDEVWKLYDEQINSTIEVIVNEIMAKSPSENKIELEQGVRAKLYQIFYQLGFAILASNLQ